ncbi:uncharacterized protein LOC129974718 [Argiope bruennichi]|uniref:uncharacterized protein LOC129974718 n=1 Tax=Argiope bruennichi TaxID=94029 RepID=UPI0024957469|nr:uncharacterized protein LOC129974718 [Argiope bruennichi]
MIKIALEMGISDRSVRQMAKTEFGLMPYKFRKSQLLTEENKLLRLQRCRAASQHWERILFTIEKLFGVQQAHNSQNDRIWSIDTPRTLEIVEHHKHPKSIMIWCGICGRGKTFLGFMDVGVKINRKVYQWDILDSVVLPWPKTHFGSVN